MITTIFRSKVDAPLALIGLTVPIAMIVALSSSGRLPPPLRWLLTIVMIIGPLLVLSLVLWTYYEIGREQLLVRSGPFCWRIPLREIVELRPSRSARSGPALSMDRLEIIYGPGRRMLISPADKAGFVAALRHRLPAQRISTER